MKFIDYGYVSSTYSSQGKTSDYVIGILRAKEKFLNLSHQRSFYVTISRAAKEAHLVMDNYKDLIKSLSNKTGDKTSAISHQTKFDKNTKLTKDNVKDKVTKARASLIKSTFKQLVSEYENLTKLLPGKDSLSSIMKESVQDFKLSQSKTGQIYDNFQKNSAYSNPKVAAKKWEELVSSHGLTKAEEMIEKTPEILGELQGKKILFFSDKNRKNAVSKIEESVNMLTVYTVAKDNLKVNKSSVDNLDKKYAEVYKSCLGFKTKDITYSKFKKNIEEAVKKSLWQIDNIDSKNIISAISKRVEEQIIEYKARYKKEPSLSAKSQMFSKAKYEYEKRNFYIEKLNKENPAKTKLDKVRQYQKADQLSKIESNQLKQEHHKSFETLDQKALINSFNYYSERADNLTNSYIKQGYNKSQAENIANKIVDYELVNNKHASMSNLKVIEAESKTFNLDRTIINNMGINEKDSSNIISQIGATGATAIANALKVNSSLTSLNLTGNNYIGGATGATAIADALKVNSSLTGLSLNSTFIGDTGAIAIADALKVNSSLTGLSLEYNSIRSSGGTAIADALKVNSSLRTLSLTNTTKEAPGNNYIGDTGAIAIADALKLNSSLTYLHLGSNNIGDTGGTAIANALKVNSSLTVLYLYSNNIGYDVNNYIATVRSNQGKYPIAQDFTITQSGSINLTPYISDEIDSDSQLKVIFTSLTAPGAITSDGLAVIINNEYISTSLSITCSDPSIETFNYKLVDISGLVSNIQTITKDHSFNCIPIANNFTVTRTGEFTFYISDHETSYDNLRIKFYSLPEKGVITAGTTTLNNNIGDVFAVTNVSYTLDSYYDCAQDNFTYTVLDENNLESELATVRLNVIDRNCRPNVESFVTNTSSDGLINFYPYVSDEDFIENLKIKILNDTVGTLKSNGELLQLDQLYPITNIRYIPNSNYCSKEYTDSFNYKVLDRYDAESELATVTININKTCFALKEFVGGNAIGLVVSSLTSGLICRYAASCHVDSKVSTENGIFDTDENDRDVVYFLKNDTTLPILPHYNSNNNVEISLLLSSAIVSSLGLLIDHPTVQEGEGKLVIGEFFGGIASGGVVGGLSMWLICRYAIDCSPKIDRISDYCMTITTIALNNLGDLDRNTEELYIELFTGIDYQTCGSYDFSLSRNIRNENVDIGVNCVKDGYMSLWLFEKDICNDDSMSKFIKCELGVLQTVEIEILPDATVIGEEYCQDIGNDEDCVYQSREETSSLYTIIYSIEVGQCPNTMNDLCTNSPYEPSHTC